jgi:hypothetical protein
MFVRVNVPTPVLGEPADAIFINKISVAAKHDGWLDW